MTAAQAVSKSHLVPQVGQPIPDFLLPVAVPGPDGAIGEGTFSASELRGRPLVLFFYPKDATCGCIVEVCGFRELYAQFQQANIAVLGVSRDTIRSHIRFIQHQNLPYPLAADPGGALMKAWGLIVPKTMYGKPVTGVLRTTLLLDSAGIVRRIYEQVTPLGHAEEVLAVAQELETGRG